ncbi:hypothetical protein IMSAGC011_01820 [Lachnospiraceae bacterium]|nr:hypothetical protein IMSAGC011_01820 [Lachnospiraceae bacterium]
MRMELEKALQKKALRYGSVLKAYRTQGGLGIGVFAGGITLLIFGILLGIFAALIDIFIGAAVFLLFGGPGLILCLIGNVKHKKRVDTYIDFFQQDTGYSALEIQQADQELMRPDAIKIGSKIDDGRKCVVYIVTEHYFLSVRAVKGCYLRKLDDIVAAFYSNEIPGIDGYRQGLFIITRQDTKKPGEKNSYTKKQYLGFENGMLTMRRDCKDVSLEVLNEMVKRAPHIITSQYISVKGTKYNLLSMDNWQQDWARILEE